MVTVWKTYINKHSFHPFILFSPNILSLILYAHICLWFPTHPGLRALQNSNAFRFLPKENLESSKWPLRQTDMENKAFEHHQECTTRYQMALEQRRSQQPLPRGKGGGPSLFWPLVLSGPLEVKGTSLRHPNYYVTPSSPTNYWRRLNSEVDRNEECSYV